MNSHGSFMTSDMPGEPYSSDFSQNENVTDTSLVPDTEDRQIFGMKSSTHGLECSPLSGITNTLHIEDLARTVSSLHTIASTQSNARKTPISKETLASRWNIGLETAHNTILATTQKGLRQAIHPIHRRYRTRQAQLRYNQLNSRFFSDTMFSPYPSLGGNTCGQIFVNDHEFTRFIPMKSKALAGDALLEFIQDVGIPSQIHTDGAPELTEGRWREVVQRHHIRQTVSHIAPGSIVLRDACERSRRLFRDKCRKHKLLAVCGTFVQFGHQRSDHSLLTQHSSCMAELPMKLSQETLQISQNG